MEFAFSDKDGEAVVTLTGRFLYADAGKVHDLIAQWDFQARPSMTMDMRFITFIDSSAIGMLFLLSGRAEEAGGRLALCNVPPSVRKTLDRANLTARAIIM